MPEAQCDFDNSPVKSPLKKINLDSYDRIESNRENNWSSSNSFGVSYVPLVNHQHEASQQSVILSEPIQEVLNASAARHFCCCSGDLRDFGSCWKLKRRQIIWESAHASAKNRTSAKATTTTTTATKTTRLAAAKTTTLSESLLPTLNSSTTATAAVTAAAATTKRWRKNHTTSMRADFAESRLPNNSHKLSNISTSLPATPNLSHLRRQYKKLSLELEECAAKQQQQHQFVTTKTQQQMSATILQTTTTTVTADFEHAPQQQMLYKNVATPAATTSKVAHSLPQIVAKNKQRNKDASSNGNNNNNDIYSGGSSSTNTAQTQTEHELFSNSNINNSAELSATTSTEAATPTHAAATTDAKSSISFCEHCCESNSMSDKSFVAYSKNDNNDYHDHRQVKRTQRADTDSVSEELSSYRFISEEEEIEENESVQSGTREEKQQQQQQQKQQREEAATLHGVVEKKTQPNQFTSTNSNNNNAVVRNLANCHSKRNKNNNNHRQKANACARSSSSSVVSPTICCYTIAARPSSIQHYSATVINHSANPSEVTDSASISTRPVPIPIVDAAATKLSEVFHFGSSDAAAEILSTSLPSNYGSARFNTSRPHQQQQQQQRYSSIPKSVKRKNANVPPAPPPKPQRDQAARNWHNNRGGVSAYSSSSGGSSSSNRTFAYAKQQQRQQQLLLERSHYDPTSFHRKLQKFEKQNTLIANTAVATSSSSLPPKIPTVISVADGILSADRKEYAVSKEYAYRSKNVDSIEYAVPEEYVVHKDYAVPENYSVHKKYAVHKEYAVPEEYAVSKKLTDREEYAIEKPPSANTNVYAERQECASPEHCDLLNCFGGAVKNTRERVVLSVVVDEPFVARSVSDSSCCPTTTTAAAYANKKCANNNNHSNNKNNNNNDHNHHNNDDDNDENQVNNSVANTNRNTSASAIEKPSNKINNNNSFNCKANAAAVSNNNQQQQFFSSSPALNKRTLRYDSYGRLKLERVTYSQFQKQQQPQQQPSVAIAQKSLSESRLPQSIANNHPFASSNRIATRNTSRKFNFLTEENITPLNGYAPHWDSNQTISTLATLPPLPLTPTSPKSPKSPISPKSPLSAISYNSSELLERSYPLVGPQLVKSLSDTSNPVTFAIEQKRCYSDEIGNLSPHKSLVVGNCKCSINQLQSATPLDNQCSQLCLSNETIASSRYLDDTQSNCSDQTTIFHLDNDFGSLSAQSSCSSPSSQACGVTATILRGPFLLKRISEIQSFGYLPTFSQPLASANVRDQAEKELNMEKRRNTLDRFQRLGFGRKSSPSPTATTPPAANQESSNKNRKPSEKSERLKELTELLRGNRSSPTPPPVPPPRKPRNGSHSASNSFEKADKQTTTTTAAASTVTSAVENKSLSFMSAPSEDILLMDQDETTTSDNTAESLELKVKRINTAGGSENVSSSISSHTNTSPRSSARLYDTLKPNTSLSNFERREKSKSPPPIAEVDCEQTVSADIDTTLTRPESRTVIGSYTQKGIPFRSASFSQIDYSSGKYKKSALSALRDRLRRDKAVDRASSPTPTPSTAGGALGYFLTREEKEVAKVEQELKKEPDWIHIPLKKTELSITLNVNQEYNCLEDVAESPDVITDEDVFFTEKSEKEDLLSIRVIDPGQTLIAHAKMESLTDTIQSENDYTITEEQLPVTVQSGYLLEEASATITTVEDAPATANEVEVAEETKVESNLATLVEEEISLESPSDNFLQTATTCLIPVSVYECAAQEWRLENPPQEWVEVVPEEFGIVPETIQPFLSLEQCSVAQTHAKTEMEHRNDMVPTISVSRSSEEPDDKDILHKNFHGNKTDSLQQSPTVERRQASLEYPEVKKRYSQDDIDIGTEKRSSLDSIATRLSTDERKRLDKSKRRKGMYIETADWCVTPVDASASASRGLALDISIANFNAIKPDTPPDECPSLMFLNSPITDDNRTPGSLNSFDLNTPESETNKPPVWSKPPQHIAYFSPQSSEEKEDAQSIGNSGGVVIQGSTGNSGRSVGVSLHRNNKSYPFLGADSISDNESDRTPPQSRDRTSPSPALSENDFKRYSKRPLRGPYGQMLEAEMKKPNKMHFEEILEELRESEGITQTRRQRNTHDGRSHEEPSVGSDRASGARNLPQYSNSMRVRKTSTFLPVPSHARAASTPSQIENVNSGVSSSTGGLNKINPHEKRYQSTLDNSTISTLSGVGASHHHHKRASSEVPSTKPHHSKRTQSMSGGEKPATHQHQQKRSLDVSNSSGGKEKNAASNLMPTQELLAELLKGSSEKLLSEQRQQMFADTRTHVVQEIFKMEQSYVDSLQTVVMKYLKVLKSPEHAGMIDSRTVDEIFFMVPDILEIHERFLAELKSRLDSWDTQQKVGDAFMETFSKLEVLEVYTSFVNNCNRAKNAIRSTKHQRPSFAKFLETTAREHKGKLTLDNLLIKPVQKFPNYEMLFTRLIKHTDHDHPDQKHLQDVLKLVHDILVHINCKEREILENGQREATLRELEGVIEGIADLIAPERQFFLFDLVSMPSGQGARKERGFFLFNDLLVLTSIKKRSGTIRKPNTTTCPGSVASTLDTNKYKFLTKISLDCLEIVKPKDENLKRIMNEIENLADDCNKLQQITDITASLKSPHQYLEDVIRELHRDVQRQLSERQTNDAQLNMLELTVNSPNGSQKLSIVFSKAEKRSQWEETFNEAKLKLAATLERHPIPEFMTSIPIRKTRAGLQFTCAAATLSEKRDVWVCNSDGYVGQVCIMSLHPEPNVTSCNGVCNARILCVASVPAYSGSSNTEQHKAAVTPHHHRRQHHHHHSDIHHQQQQQQQQQRDYRKSSSPNCQSAPNSSLFVQPDRKKPNSSAIASPAASAGGGVCESGNNDIQLDLNFSSSDDEVDAGVIGTGGSSISTERIPSPAPSTHTTGSTSTASTAITGSSTASHQQQDSNPEEGDGNQSTMWIGTEDGCIHVYNSTDNIRIKKNRIKIEHHSAVYSILYLDNRVFVSLANGDICVYLRDGVGWNTSSSHCLSIGSVSSPVSKLLSVHGKLWCSIQGIIKVLDIETLLVVNQIQISSDSKPITNMTVSNNHVWISIQNSAHIKCFHSNSHQLITEVNLAPAVNKMLSNCDEIIRQHKAACLRVTSLLSCKDLIWIGTSAGVLLTIPAQGYEKSTTNVVPTGIPHGHTGHVRFLTFVETATGTQDSSAAGSTGTAAGTSTSTKDSGGDSAGNEYKNQSSSKHTKTKSESNNILIISGGDGYEDFRNSGANSLSEIAGREDSTNHLLIWHI